MSLFQLPAFNWKQGYRDDKKKRPHYEDPDLEEYRLKVVNCRGRISELPEAEEVS